MKLTGRLRGFRVALLALAAAVALVAVGPATAASADSKSRARSVKATAKKNAVKKKVTAPAPKVAATLTWWRPTPGLTWQWQLSGRLDRSVAAAVYDVDWVSTTAADVTALHQAGRKVICYVNVGAYENWRPDVAAFPAVVLGKNLDGWAGERWLDIRRWDVLGPIMTARFKVCQSKGFDAVEPDNMDGYTQASGFAITATDQLTYNRRIADLAHSLGLAVGLKNDVEQVSALVTSFDFAVNESCAEWAECAMLKPFTAAGKAVFHVEYDKELAQFCTDTRRLGFSSMRKRYDLGVWRQPCA